MMFINSEINDIHLEGLFFRIFEIPAASKNLDFQVRMCFASKILPHGNTVFTETTVFNFIENNSFWLCLANDKPTS